MINKKDYTLLLLRGVEGLFTKVRSFVQKNSDILEITKNEPFEIEIEDKSRYSKFRFSISNPRQDSSKVIFDLKYNPYNSADLSTKKSSTNSDSTLKILEQWTNIIRSYNNLRLSPEDSILNEYEKEFFSNFELLDEDADINPYELDKQIIIHNYFVHVIQLLEKNEEDNKELIEEAYEIKENIPKMTKRTTIKRMSSFFAKVRKKSLPLLKELLEVGRKEVFKKAVKFLLDNMTDLLTMIG